MTRKGGALHLAAPGTGADLELGQGDDYVVLGVLAGVFGRRTAATDGGRRTADGGWDCRRRTAVIHLTSAT